MDQADDCAYPSSACSSSFSCGSMQCSEAPLEIPPGLAETSYPNKKGREALNHKVLRVLHTLHLTYMEHQAAVEAAQAKAAPWKSKLKSAWEDVPLPDAEDGEFESWLKKWDPMTDVEV